MAGLSERLGDLSKPIRIEISGGNRNVDRQPKRIGEMPESSVERCGECIAATVVDELWMCHSVAVRIWLTARFVERVASDTPGDVASVQSVA